MAIDQLRDNINKYGADPDIEIKQDLIKHHQNRLRHHATYLDKKHHDGSPVTVNSLIEGGWLSE